MKSSQNLSINNDSTFSDSLNDLFNYPSAGCVIFPGYSYFTF